MSDIPIPPEVVEAAARAIERWIVALVDNDTRATERLNEERIIIADSALRAGLEAWPGMYTDDETMYGKVIGKTIFLPITENSNDKA